MKSIIKLILVFGFIMTAFSPRVSKANLASQFELELALEKKVSALVLRYDPLAFVRVNLSFKKLSAPLPGTSIDLKNFSIGGEESGGARADEVQSTTITIVTAKGTLPEWLRTEIMKSMPELKANLDVKPMSEEVKKALVSVDDPTGRSPASVGGGGSPQEMAKYSERVAQISSATSWRIAGALGGLAVFCLLAGSGVAFALLKRKLVEMNRVIEARLIPAIQNLGNVASEGGGGGNRTTVVQATLSAPQGGFGGGGGGGGGGSGAATDVATLSFDAIETLFTDCYWCERDSYAAWLWSVMTPAQRMELFNSKKVDPGYVKSIQSLPRERQEDHLDPVYLKPLAIHHVNQEDLARWVEAFKPGFHLLSPMRQFTLPLSLKSRLACLAEPMGSNTKVPPIPERPSPKRIVKSNQRMGDLSFEDETTILHNPAMIAENMKPMLRSLVWLALKPLDFRQKVMNDFSAEELASAWIGSPEVLARLLESLSEKKRTMLESYLKTVETNRKAYVYTKLVDQGLSTAGLGGNAAPAKAA